MHVNTVNTVLAEISRGPFRKSYRNSFCKTSLLCDPNFSHPKIVVCIDGNYKVVYVLLTLMHCSDSLSSFSCSAYTEHSSWSASACLRHIMQKYFRYINSHYGCNMQPLTRFCVLFHLSYWTTVLHFDASYWLVSLSLSLSLSDIVSICSCVCLKRFSPRLSPSLFPISTPRLVRTWLKQTEYRSCVFFKVTMESSLYHFLPLNLLLIISERNWLLSSLSRGNVIILVTTTSTREQTRPLPMFKTMCRVVPALQGQALPQPIAALKTVSNTSFVDGKLRAYLIWYRLLAKS